MLVSMSGVAEFVLSDEERERLGGWSRGSSRLAMRAKIVWTVPALVEGGAYSAGS